jgi:hypothetical protein
MSYHQNARSNYNSPIANESFENVAWFTYLGTTATNQNCFHEEIKSILNSGNACYHSVQNLLSSCLSENLQINMYRTIILPVLYECETQSLTYSCIEGEQGAEENIWT